MVKNISIDEMRLDGNALCLDFINTIYNRFETPLRNHLGCFDDLLYWAGKKVTLLSSDQAAAIVDRPGAYEEAMALRTVLDRVFYSYSQKVPIAPEDMAALNRVFAFYRVHELLRPEGLGFVRTWDWTPDDFHWITAPIVASAWDLLNAAELPHVGACPSCGWLFLDLTRNHRRRWCSMEGCGSAAKAREYYHRKKSA